MLMPVPIDGTASPRLAVFRIGHEANPTIPVVEEVSIGIVSLLIVTTPGMTFQYVSQDCDPATEFPGARNG